VYILFLLIIIIMYCLQAEPAKCIHLPPFPVHTKTENALIYKSVKQKCVLYAIKKVGHLLTNSGLRSSLFLVSVSLY